MDEGFVHLIVDFHKMDYQNLKEFMGYLIQFCKFRFDESFMDNHKTLELKFKPVKDTLNLDFIDNYIPIEKD